MERMGKIGKGEKGGVGVARLTEAKAMLLCGCS
jgi:hypothetical protein